MKSFLARFGTDVEGVLSGFDRLVFRGHLIPLIRPSGMYAFLKRTGIRLLDFKDYVSTTSDRIKKEALDTARLLERPIRYLRSSKTNKEALVQQLFIEQPVNEGLICLFTTVEPCMSFEYHRSEDPTQRGLKFTQRKCLHLYRYFIHRTFGLIGTRLQTWFPFNIQIWLNGREWLSVQLRENGIDFERADNTFTFVADSDQAQRLLTLQRATNWPAVLAALGKTIHPLHDDIVAAAPMDYYWSVYQSEWATDLLFRTPSSLARLYPRLYRHATLHFQSPDVMRFLGRKLHGNFTGELTSRFKNRLEGIRVKHWVHGNSLKMYDKAGVVLRVETTLADTTPFRAFRAPQNRPDDAPSWKPMRKGIADLNRRAEVSDAANSRYLDALAAVDDSQPLGEVFDRFCRPVVRAGVRTRAIRIGDPLDVALLEAISRGEFAVNGFRNRDLRPLLFSSAKPDQIKPLAAKTTRLLRLLRAHGLIQKVPKTHRYLLTPLGTQLAASLSAARRATTRELLAA